MYCNSMIGFKDLHHKQTIYYDKKINYVTLMLGINYKV